MKDKFGASGCLGINKTGNPCHYLGKISNLKLDH